MSLDWLDAANLLHVRLKAMAWIDTLADRIIDLHQPRFTMGEQPTCEGCDRDDRTAGDAVWPCRTYTLTASLLLNVDNIENVLTDLRATVANQQQPDSLRRTRRPAASVRP